MSEQSSGAGEFAVLVVLVGVSLIVSCAWRGRGWACVNGLRGRRLGRATRGVGRKCSLWENSLLSGLVLYINQSAFFVC